MKKIQYGILVSLFLGAVMIEGTAKAQEGIDIPDIGVALVLLDANGNPTQEIQGQELLQAVITLENLDADDVIAAKWFSQQDFHLKLIFRHYVNGKLNMVITKKELFDSPEFGYNAPMPPVKVDPSSGRRVQGEPVETLGARGGPDPFVLATQPFDPREFYDLTDPNGDWMGGVMEVQALIPITVFLERLEGSGDFAPLLKNGAPNYVPCGDEDGDPSDDWGCTLPSNIVTLNIPADADRDDFYYPVPSGSSDPEDCDDSNPAVNPGAEEILGNGIDDDCNPATPDELATGSALFKAFKLTVGFFAKPRVTKEPLAGLPIKLFDLAPDACVKTDHGLAWRYWDEIYAECNPVAQGATGLDGKVTIDLPPGSYLALGEFLRPSGDSIHIGRIVKNLDSDEVIKKRMFVLARARGSWLPCKHTILSGSELDIIEPEYVEWDTEEELYPFVFDSQGDWEVTTSLSPPEGFVTDHESLTEEVDSELKAVQFTLTDVGTEWIDAGVTYDVKHRDKKGKIRRKLLKRKVGVRLSRKFAKKKNLDRFGKKLRKKIKKKIKKKNKKKNKYKKGKKE